ncbi:Positive regulator of sigma E activity [Magnetospirillum sp. LM-5]|uniref:SoxR reducing system RseC family protein n=1 Tax=Magnetospirillum sp. LM-5 TaxID=2681466 RepID=UPI00137D43F4|nr:SoxR reducing system RseC family protein [Magnetospirillum sp. LM-5]CAA7625821.1 Positive regulator of sigma E activity [Magnetospirillum sp. LM-5]
MQASGSTLPSPDDRELIEGFARVVAVEPGRVWLEPEQTSSCGGCHSAGLCGVGSRNPKRLELRRFALGGDLGLRMGERVVVGIPETSLSRGALVAFGVPLVFLAAGGIAGQELGRSDGLAFVGAVVGLAVGLLVSRVLASVMTARGQLTPRFLRRAYQPAQGASCTPDQG